MAIQGIKISDLPQVTNALSGSLIPMVQDNNTVTAKVSSLVFNTCEIGTLTVRDDLNVCCNLDVRCNITAGGTIESTGDSTVGGNLTVCGQTTSCQLLKACNGIQSTGGNIFGGNICQTGDFCNVGNICTSGNFLSGGQKIDDLFFRCGSDNITSSNVQVANLSATGQIIGNADNNIASGQNSSIIGGENNNTNSKNSFIGAGKNNSINTYGFYSFIGGGVNNKAKFANNFIGSGDSNLAGGSGGITTGISNTAVNGFVGAGFENCSSGVYTSIVGGRENVATGNHSSVGGGCLNSATGSESTIGGGRNQAATGVASTIAGGCQNASPGNYSFIGGGISNRASGVNSTVAGGKCLSAVGNNSFVGGGYKNKARGSCSAIVGGENNEVLTSHSNSFIIGSNLTSNAACTTFVNNISSQSNIYAGGNILSAGVNLEDLFSTASIPTLQQVTGIGNTTTNSISSNNSIIANDMETTTISAINVTGQVPLIVDASSNDILGTELLEEISTEDGFLIATDPFDIPDNIAEFKSNGINKVTINESGVLSAQDVFSTTALTSTFSAAGVEFTIVGGLIKSVRGGGTALGV